GCLGGDPVRRRPAVVSDRARAGGRRLRPRVRRRGGGARMGRGASGARSRSLAPAAVSASPAHAAAGARLAQVPAAVDLPLEPASGDLRLEPVLRAVHVERPASALRARRDAHRRAGGRQGLHAAPVGPRRRPRRARGSLLGGTVVNLVNARGGHGYLAAMALSTLLRLVPALAILWRLRGIGRPAFSHLMLPLRVWTVRPTRGLTLRLLEGIAVVAPRRIRRGKSGSAGLAVAANAASLPAA